MNKDEISELLDKEYSKNKETHCPALGNELVYFNHEGLRHLKRKGEKIRPINDQIRRFYLLSYAMNIISNSQIISNYRTNIDKKGVKIQFWTLSKIIKNRNVKIVIRQVENRPKHFFSIFDKKEKPPEGGLSQAR
ncbi:MAG: hypothetical protein NTV72_01160 [Candidatus Taylorbacteria bacterium]|nr:hypothetical protein [Candidatus Taylorbacteria bacterium]